jgi:acetyl esterase/lipase
MSRKPFATVLAVIAIINVLCPAPAQEAAFTRKADVIYGRKDGMALTMDVFTPRNPNGAAVVLVVSGGYYSAHEMIRPEYFRVLLERGYTVFAVVHGSQPRYQVPDIVKDMNRAVRFIRHHAKDYGIDPNRIGIIGASSGGNLALMVGTAGDTGNPAARDPVDRESSRVQAVACFFPPTDWLNWGRPGQELVGAMAHAPPFRGAFDYREMDAEKRTMERVTDAKKLREISRASSPIYFVSKETPPTLICHGDQDTLVPLYQSETFVEKLKAAGVAAELVVKKGAGHGWAGIDKDAERFADWFDKHLARKAAEVPKGK